MEATATEIEDGEIVRRVLAGEEELFEIAGPPLPGAGGLARHPDGRATARTRSTWPRRSSSRSSRRSTASTRPTSSRPGSSGSPATPRSTTCASAVPGPCRSRRPTPTARRRRFPPEQRSNGLDPYGELRNTGAGQAIHRAIQELPPDFRELIALRHFAGLSYEEIAVVKKMPLGTVKNKLFRARVVLKDRLAGEVT